MKTTLDGHTMKEVLPYYMPLLTQWQQEATRAYLGGASISEIAKKHDVSTNSASVVLHTVERTVNKYEEKLGLYSRVGRALKQLESAEDAIESACIRAAKGENVDDFGGSALGHIDFARRSMQRLKHCQAENQEKAESQEEEESDDHRKQST